MVLWIRFDQDRGGKGRRVCDGRSISRIVLHLVGAVALIEEDAVGALTAVRELDDPELSGSEILCVEGHVVLVLVSALDFL